VTPPGPSALATCAKYTMRGDVQRSIWMFRTGPAADGGGAIWSTVHQLPSKRPKPPYPKPTQSEPSLGSQATAEALFP
jgi:hypothetical protein